jgi:hypothetical protein
VIGICGLACDECPLYINGKCKGCEGVLGVSEPICSIVKCAKDKNVASCAECSEFVCPLLAKGTSYNMLKSKMGA